MVGESKGVPSLFWIVRRRDGVVVDYGLAFSGVLSFIFWAILICSVML